MTVLAQSANHDAIFSFVLWATLILIATSIGAIVVARKVRGWAGGGSTDTAQPFTIQDLREMRAAGDITDAEFERMRAAIIGSFKRADDAAVEARQPESGAGDS